MMKRFIFSAALLLGLVSSALAQSSALPGIPGLPRGFFGCVFNSTPPTLGSGQSSAIQCNNNGYLQIIGTGSAGSAAAGVVTVQGITSMTPFLTNPGTAANWGVGATGSTVPANAVYMGTIGPSSNLRGWTSVNPSGSIFAGQVDLASVAGATIATGNGTASGSIRVTQASDSTGITQLVPGTASGLSMFTVNVAASDNHANIKNGAGQVYGIQAFNNNAAANYIRLYNAATGFNGCGSATNLVWSGIVPGSTTGAGFVVPFGDVGVAFATGISICVSGAFGNTDTTSAVTNTSVNVSYK